MSLRGIDALTGLRELCLHSPTRLDHLRGATELRSLSIDYRGWQRPLVDLAPLAALSPLRELTLYWLSLDGLASISKLPLRKLELRFCGVKPQRLRLPSELEVLDLDDTSNLRLLGHCPKLRHVDLWATQSRPMDWLGQHEGITELWLCGCDDQRLDPLLELEWPPAWILMDPPDDPAELDRQRPILAALEAKGTRVCIGDPHEAGIWIPSMKVLSQRDTEPVYLSPGWPRERPNE